MARQARGTEAPQTGTDLVTAQEADTGRGRVLVGLHEAAQPQALGQLDPV